MCHQLRTAAMHLEQAARQVHEAGGADPQGQVQVRVGELQQAVQTFHAYLQSIGV